MTEKMLTYKEYYRKFSLPMIVRFIFDSIMYSADRIIAAAFIGAQALVVTTLISPLLFIIAGVSSLFIGGMGAYVGFLIGKDQTQRANKISTGIILIMGFIGVVMLIPSFFFSRQMVGFLGARNEMLTMAVSYMKIIAFSFPLLLVAKGLDMLILNDESPKYSFKLNVATTVLNLSLNVLLVGVFKMGIAGLGIATVTSTLFQLFGAGFYFIKKSKIIHLSKPIIEFKVIKRICFNGSSDFVMMIVEAFMVFVINRAFIAFLSPQHFEAYAAASIIFTLFYGVHMGATMGIQPKLSQWMGSRNFKMLRGILKYGIKKTYLYAILAYVVLIPIMPLVLRIFISDSETIRLGVFFYVTIGFATMFSNIPLQVSIFFTAINRPVESVLISVLRTFIFIPAITYLAIYLFSAWGVSLALILSDIILTALIFIYFKRTKLENLKVAD